VSRLHDLSPIAHFEAVARPAWQALRAEFAMVSDVPKREVGCESSL